MPVAVTMAFAALALALLDDVTQVETILFAQGFKISKVNEVLSQSLAGFWLIH